MKLKKPQFFLLAQKLHTDLNRTVGRRKLLSRRHRNRNTRITTATGVRGVTVVPAQIWRKSYMSLREGTLIRRTKNTVRRMYCGIGTRSRRYIEGLMHNVLMANDRYTYYGMSLAK